VNKAAKARMDLGTDILHEAQDIEEGDELSPQPQKSSHPSLAMYIAVFKEVCHFQLI
jgi:hypothetical protein